MATDERAGGCDKARGPWTTALHESRHIEYIHLQHPILCQSSYPPSFCDDVVRKKQGVRVDVRGRPIRASGSYTERPISLPQTSAAARDPCRFEDGARFVSVLDAEPCPHHGAALGFLTPVGVRKTACIFRPGPPRPDLRPSPGPGTASVNVLHGIDCKRIVRPGCW